MTMTSMTAAAAVETVEIVEAWKIARKIRGLLISTNLYRFAVDLCIIAQCVFSRPLYVVAEYAAGSVAVVVVVVDEDAPDLFRDAA